MHNLANLLPPQRLLWVVTALLAIIVHHGGPGVEACSMPVGWRPLTAVEKVLNAPVVLYGRTRAVYPDDRFTYGSRTTVYTANVEVYCIMKGDRTGQFVNITEAG